MFTEHFSTIVIAAATPNLGGFVGAARDFIAPIFLLIVGIFALKLLVADKSIRGFIEFLVLAALVATVFYYPGIVEAIASWVAGLFYGGTAPTPGA